MQQGLRVYDAARLASAPEDALVARTPLGSSPVPVGLLGGGLFVIVGNSDRFNAGRDSSLWLFKAPSGEGFRNHLDIACPGFPREFAVTKDGCYVLSTQFFARAVVVTDARGLVMGR